MKALVVACMILLLDMHGASARQSVSTGAAPPVGKAVQLMQSRLFGEAAAEFEQALAVDPNNDAVRIQYAVCLFAQERNDETRKQFEIVRQRLGEWPGFNYYVGRLDLRANDFASAIKRLAPLESNPAFSKVSLYLGLAYMSAGQQARALECLERAARKNPEDPEVHYRLARVYSMDGRTNDANREYKLYRDASESQRVMEQYGQQCRDALRTQPIVQARVVCQRVADPNDSRRLALLGQLYAENGSFSDAIEPLQQAVKLDPKSFEAWHNLGFSLLRLQRYQEALLALRNAASLNPQYFATLALLAFTLRALGDDAGALSVLERAHMLNPDDAQVTSALEQLRMKLKRK